MPFSIRNLLLPLLLAASGIASASTVTVTLVQNEQAPSVALQMSQTIEDELMSGFFASGHIVSNTEIRFDGLSFDARNFGLKDAALGMSDYLLAVSLQYNPAEKKETEGSAAYAQLDGLIWRLVKVDGGSVVAEKKLDLSKVPITDFDPYKQSRNVASFVGRDCLLLLSKSSQGGTK